MDNLENNVEKSRFYNRLHLIIRISAAFLVLFFGFLKLRDIPIVDFINPSIKDYLIKITLFLYFSAWVFGGSMDINLHRKIHDHIQKKWELKKWLYPFIISLVVVFGLLCYFQDIKVFLIILLVFKILDNIGVKIVISQYVLDKEIVKYCDETQEMTTKLARKYFIDLFNGESRKFRAFFDLVLASSLVVLSFLNPDLTIHLADNTLPLLQLSVLLFIVISEVWLFLIRFKTLISINVLSEINDYLK